jgi:hypothetical protein
MVSLRILDRIGLAGRTHFRFSATTACGTRPPRSYELRPHAEVVLLPGPLWRCRQQPLRPENLCFSEIVQACLSARTYPRYKKRSRGQLPYLVDGEKTVGDSDAIISHLITRYALTIDDDLTANQRGHRSFGKTDARRSLLGHVLFALGRSPLLAAFPGSPSDDTSRHYRSSLGSGTGVQFYALPLSRYWSLRAQGSLCQRYRGPKSPGGPCSWQRFSIRGPASQHRCGHLWIYGQYVFLCDRHPFEELSPIAAKSRGALSSDPRCARRLSDHGCRDRCHRRMRNAKSAAQFKLFLLRVKLTSRSTRIICSTWLYAA